MPSFLVTIKSGEQAGRSLIIENVFNEAAAIDETFKRAGLNKEITCKEPCECCFVQIEILKVPINENQKTDFKARVCRDVTDKQNFQ